jgi:APA family basic amino acid/polyamine antiporter
VGIVTEMLILVLGLLFAWKPDLLVDQWRTDFPSLSDLSYATSLAIISFVGLESISQAAQETRRPATIIPRTSITLVFTVFLFAVGFSTLALGILPWQSFDGKEGEAVSILAKEIPFLGAVAGPVAAALGAGILAISANSGVMSASRVTYSMSRYQLLPTWFTKIHERFSTPARTITVFSMVAVVQTVFAFLTASALATLADTYAFGAALGYTLVFASLITLRFVDPFSPRPYKMPLNITKRIKDRIVDVPILGTVGIAGIGIILLDVLRAHETGRVAGPLWVIVTLVFYVIYRRRSGLPVGTVKRDWEADQIAVLTSAEEYELLEEYKAALEDRDAARRPKS